MNGQRVAGDKDFDDSTGALKDTAAESIEGTSKGNVRGRAALSQPLLLTEETTVQLLSWLSGATQEEVHTGNSEGSTTFVPAEFRVTDIDQKQVQRSPPLPLITSSLQQEASSKLSLSPARTMSIAQELYEKGYISYMRTDSPKLSQLATDIGTSFIKQTFGDEYLGTSAAPSQTKKKAPAIPKNAQEAHEAIRPAVMETAEGVSRFYQPNEISFSSDMHRALYVLILQRTLASLMGPSISDTTTFTITARRDDSSTETIKNTDSATFEDVKLRTSVTSLRFKGYTAAYDLWPNTAESSTGEFVFQHYVDNKQPDEPSPFASVSENDRLWLHTSSANSLATWTPDENENLSNGNTNSESEVESNGEESKLTSTTDTDTASGPGLLSISGVRGTQHHTRPPTRFTEASFIRELEEIGVGRPSTYSAIFQKLKEREYVLVDKRSIMPTVRGILVTNLLEQHFLSVVDSNFTAIMESQLDSIAKGQRNKLDFLQQFYLGSEEVNTGLLPRVEKLVARDVIDHTESRTIRLPFLKDIDCEVVLASSGLAIEKVNPDGSSRTRWGLPPNMQLDIRELTSESIRTVMETQLTTEGTSLGAYDNGDGGGPRAVYIRSGRFGKYLQLGENFDKLRRTYSLPSWVDENTDKSDLLSFIEFPKTVCVHPTLNIPIEAEVKFGHMYLKFFGFTFEREVFNIMPRELTPEFALNMFSDLNESSWKDMYLGDLNGTPILMFPTKSKKGYYLRSGSMFAQLNSKEKEELTLASAVEILRMKGRILGGKNKTPKVIKPQEKPTGKPTGRPRKVVESVKADSSTETLPKEILSRKEKKAKPRVDKSKKSTKVKPEKLATKSTTVNKSPTTKTIKTSKPVLNGYCRFLNQCTAKGIKFKEALSKWQGMTADEKLLL